MKKSIKKSSVELVAQYIDIKARLKNLNAIEKTLKDDIKALMQDENKMVVGEYSLVLKEITRTSLDKKALTILLGDKLSNFQSTTTYKTLNIA